MFQGQSSIIIHQPVEVVFAILPYIGTNPGATFRSVQQIPEGSIGIGTILCQNGSGMTIITEVTEYEPHRKITLQQEVSGCLRAKAIGRYNLESTAESTIVTLRAEMQGTGWFWLLLEVFRLSGMTTLVLRTNLIALKNQIESQARIPGSYHISGPLPAANIGQLLSEEDHS